ncbi:MAG: hypothetical protein AAGD14_02680 [Planctomycetota bacterium]
MSQSLASLLVVLVLFILAVYVGISPPEGFQEFPYRIILPFVLVAVGFVQLENQRMRVHMAELIGAIKAAVGQARAQQGAVQPTPEQRAEAIEILLKSLNSQDATARATAAKQLAKLTGVDHGEDAVAWARWWSENESQFRA